MTNISGPHNIRINGQLVTNVNEFNYLGHLCAFGHKSTENEVHRRTKLAWAAFGKLKDIFNGDYTQGMKTKVFDQCVLPTLTYASETWPLTNDTLQTIAKCQRAMERKMLNIRLADRIPNAEIRRRTKTDDAVTRILKLKHSWAGHISRADNITTLVNNWTPREDKRKRGRPPTRWDDDLRRCYATTWRRLTRRRRRKTKSRGRRRRRTKPRSGCVVVPSQPRSRRY